ncbi:uncharacterized protein METZ01_LOCUS390107, partial [marine metagenome]
MALTSGLFGNFQDGGKNVMNPLKSIT